MLLNWDAAREWHSTYLNWHQSESDVDFDGQLYLLVRCQSSHLLDPHSRRLLTGILQRPLVPPTLLLLHVQVLRGCLSRDNSSHRAHLPIKNRLRDVAVQKLDSSIHLPSSKLLSWFSSTSSNVLGRYVWFADAVDFLTGACVEPEARRRYPWNRSRRERNESQRQRTWEERKVQTNEKGLNETWTWRTDGSPRLKFCESCWRESISLTTRDVEPNRDSKLTAFSTNESNRKKRHVREVRVWNLIQTDLFARLSRNSV